MKRFLIILTATGLYSGYGPIAPGTWGSIPPLIIAYLIGGNQTILIPLAILITAISVYVSTEAEKIFGHDGRQIVIDEWAGMLVTLIFIPVSIINYVIAFFMFRLFDVVKPPPAAQFEKLPSGWGITMDDIAAGVYANLTTHGIIYLIAYFQLI